LQKERATRLELATSSLGSGEQSNVSEAETALTTNEIHACTTACTSFEDLAKIVAAWPRLVEPIRRAMLALIQSAGMLFGPAMLAAWRLC
jgi:hypothetical protein